MWICKLRHEGADVSEIAEVEVGGTEGTNLGGKHKIIYKMILGLDFRKSYKC